MVVLCAPERGELELTEKGAIIKGDEGEIGTSVCKLVQQGKKDRFSVLL
jgi:hypothetical protein